MNVKIIPIYRHLDAYVADVEKGEDTLEALWEKYAIEPYWEILCQYAPFDISDRKPKPITDIMTLKSQLDLLMEIDLAELEQEFQKIVNLLPNYDDDLIYVALYPLSDENKTVKERQNGVVGTSTFGNIFIEINPLADQFHSWIPYVFAHEHHHTVWGNYWYVLRENPLANTFIHALLIDGEADSFALSLYSDLKPKWLFDLSAEAEEALWKEHYANLVLQENVDYCKYMFGDERAGIPWCAGYAIGFRIVQTFLASNPNVSFAKLLEMNPMDIYRESGYRNIKGDE